MELTNEDFGVNTFRLNMCGDKRFSSDADILDAFETIKAVGGVAQVHAESGDVIEREERAMIGRGITGKDGLAESQIRNHNSDNNIGQNAKARLYLTCTQDPF